MMMVHCLLGAFCLHVYMLFISSMIACVHAMKSPKYGCIRCVLPCCVVSGLMLYENKSGAWLSNLMHNICRGIVYKLVARFRI